MFFHNLQPKSLPDTPAGIQPKKSDQTSIHILLPGIHLEFSNHTNFYIAQLGSIPTFPRNHPWVAPSSYPFTSREKFHRAHPSSTLLLFHTKRKSFHTPNLPPILLSHPLPLHLPHPDSGSHMVHTRLPLRPHWSHCTHIPGWIPLPGPVPDSSPGYSRESSHAQELRSGSYPENSHSLFFVSVKPASSIV